MTDGWSLPRREAWLTALGIFAVALVVRALTASIIGFPKPEDTAYYVGVARNLVEGRGLVADALWSYGTPPLVFPRPAFEVWLPLPSLLSAVPVALLAGPAPISLESAMRAAQVIPVLAGAAVSVLAWRLAADVAAERGLPAGRARTLAIGTGLASAVYLPLLLHAALPDSTMLFGALVLGACLLMTRVLADPRGARWTDPRLIGAGLLLGGAALTRNEAVWLAAVWAWLAWRRGGEPRAVRVRMIAVVAVAALARLRAVGRPQLGGVREPAARPDDLERAVRDRLRHLRVERPADALALPRPGTAGAHRGACHRHRPQPVQRPAAARDPDLRGRAPRAAVAGPRPCAAAGAAGGRDHLPRDQPRVPGRDDLGHVPPRRGATSTCCC